MVTFVVKRRAVWAIAGVLTVGTYGYGAAYARTVEMKPAGPGDPFNDIIPIHLTGTASSAVTATGGTLFSPTSHSSGESVPSTILDTVEYNATSPYQAERRSGLPTKVVEVEPPHPASLAEIMRR